MSDAILGDRTLTVSDESDLFKQMGEIRQQLGFITASLSGIKDSQEQARQVAERATEALWVEMRTIKHDRRNKDQVVQGSLERLTEQGRRVQTQLGQMKSDMAEMKVPIAQFVGLRNRVTTGAFILAGIGGAAFAVIGPLWDFIAHRLLSRLIGGGG